MSEQERLTSEQWPRAGVIVACQVACRTVRVKCMTDGLMRQPEGRAAGRPTETRNLSHQLCTGFTSPPLLSPSRHLRADYLTPSTVNQESPPKLDFIRSAVFAQRSRVSD